MEKTKLLVLWFILKLYARINIFTQELSFMTLKSDAKFQEKLTCGLENEMANLASFTGVLESLKIATLMESFY